MAKTTQYTKILKHLKVTKGLTQREALLDYSIQSFTARISELRKLGYNIDGVKSRHPVSGQRYTRYVLVESAA
jgi:hypothetical protein